MPERRIRSSMVWLGLAICSGALATASLYVVVSLGTAVLSGDTRGNFVGGYFSGAARAVFVAALAAFTLSSLLTCLFALMVRWRKRS